jgi:hypothetical protein
VEDPAKVQAKDHLCSAESVQMVVLVAAGSEVVVQMVAAVNAAMIVQRAVQMVAAVSAAMIAVDLETLVVLVRIGHTEI